MSNADDADSGDDANGGDADSGVPLPEPDADAPGDAHGDVTPDGAAPYVRAFSAVAD